MKGYNVKLLLDKAKDYLVIDFGEIVLDPGKSIYHCEADYDNRKFRIGIKEISENMGKDFSFAEAMHPVVGLFHEVCGHGGQLRYEFKKDTPLSKVLALNYYACNGSANYYGIQFKQAKDGKIIEFPTDQYFRQPHEIAAQYAGIYCAYRFLQENFGANLATKMICSYVNERVADGTEYIQTKKHYTSVEDILNDFNRTFQKRVFEHRKYQDNPGFPDLLKSYARQHGQMETVSKVIHCPNGMIEDYRMCTVYMQRFDPSKFIRTSPVFGDMDLSIEAAFGFLPKPVHPKPKPKDLALSNLTDVQKPKLMLSVEDLKFAEQFHITSQLLK